MKLLKFCYDVKIDQLKFPNKNLPKQSLECSEDGPKPEYRRGFDKAISLKSTNREIKTSNHFVGHMSKLEKNPSTFIQKGKILKTETVPNHKVFSSTCKL